MPEGWLRTTLGDIAVVSSGSTPSRTRPEYWGGHIPWVTTSEVNYRPIAETREYVTALALDAVPLRVYPAGTILMAMYGQGVTRGRVAILDIDATINQACCAITLKGDAEPSYVSLLLEFLYPKIRTLGHGGNQQNLNAEIVRQIPIVLPPKEEQQRILEILVAWDRAIENLEYQIEAKRARKRGLMQVLLTGKKRFKEFQVHGWRNAQLADVARVQMGSSPKSSAYNSDGIGLPLIQGNADIAGRVSAPRVWTSQVTRECYEGDILMSVRAPVGEVARSIHHACIGRGIAAIRAQPNLADQGFLYQYLLYLEPSWGRVSQGSTFEAVNSKEVRSFEIHIPANLDEQRKIAALLATADHEIEVLLKQLEAYQAQKRGLMQQLLTGKKRVKVDGQEAVPA